MINLAGRNSTLTFEQSGAGVLRFSSALLISGYGASKTIMLRGDTAGVGDLAGDLADPHDRTGNAKTTVVKSGVGTWTLSGVNTFTGRTQVTQGTLVLPHRSSLGSRTELHVADGATIDLHFTGEMHIAALHINGQAQPAGIYRAADFPKGLRGTGVLVAP